mgnify:CR=1 FL=1|tara:strand:+ start:147 stop:350 length:204 start_codon:yes stop_codon:yes gene_type:complete
METNEYFEKIKDLDPYTTSPEFPTYTTVWLQSNMPATYSELKHKFKEIESEIMARHESNDPQLRLPF